MQRQQKDNIRVGGQAMESARPSLLQLRATFQHMVESQCQTIDKAYNSLLQQRIADLGKGEAEYINLTRAASGDVVEPEDWQRIRGRRNQLRKDSYEIADLLEEAGVSMYDEKKDLWKVGIFSGTVERLPNFRANKFIPEVAGMKRAKMLSALEYYLERNPHSRMWVFTNGERCKVENLRTRFEQMHRDLSKLNAEKFMKNAGVRIVFRASEVGSVKVSDSSGPLYHPHAHCIVTMSRKLSRAKWSALLARVRSFWSWHFADARAIGNVREVVKYCAKPADLKLLVPGELKDVFYALAGLHLVQPMGEFRKFLSTLKEGKKRIVRKRTEHGLQLRIVNAWDAQPRKKNDVEKLQDELAKLEKDREKVPTIMARLLPGPHFGPVSEPAFIVRNYTGNLQSILKQSHAKRLIKHGSDNWQAGLALARQQYGGSKGLLAAKAATPPYLGSQITRNCPADKTKISQKRERAFFSGGEKPLRRSRQTTIPETLHP